MSKKTILLGIILLLLILSGAVAFLFRDNIQSLLLGSNNNYAVPKKDFRGEMITLNAGGRQLSIPPNFSEEVLSYLKQEMTESGGLPLEIEKKGNPLPFGIP